MRWAFYAYDNYLGQKLVAKHPKAIDEGSYNVETMKKDLESQFICSHIVDDFNSKLLPHI